MKNLINLFSRKISVNNGLIVKRMWCNIDGNYSKNYAVCSCPAVMTYNNITSNNRNKLSKIDYLKKHDSNKRFLSSNSGPPSTKLPPLMNFPEIMWPSVIKSIRNFILSTFIIKPYFDKDFNLPDFVRGSKQALEVDNIVLM